MPAVKAPASFIFGHPSLAVVSAPRLHSSHVTLDHVLRSCFHYFHSRQDQPRTRRAGARPSRITHLLSAPFPIPSYFHHVHRQPTASHLAFYFTHLLAYSFSTYSNGTSPFRDPSTRQFSRFRLTHHTLSQCPEAKERASAERPLVLRTVEARARRATARRLVCR
jgi:hypothetical protein